MKEIRVVVELSTKSKAGAENTCKDVCGLLDNDSVIDGKPIKVKTSVQITSARRGIFKGVEDGHRAPDP
jgi:hypothetical protein